MKDNATITKTLKKAANLLQDSAIRQRTLNVHSFSDGFFLSSLSEYAALSHNEPLKEFVRKKLNDHKRSNKFLKTVMGLCCASAAKKVDDTGVFLDLVTKGEKLAQDTLSISPKVYEPSMAERVAGFLPNYIRSEELISLSDFLLSYPEMNDFSGRKRAMISKVRSYDALLFDESRGLYYSIYNTKRREAIPKGDLPLYPMAYALFVFTKLRPLCDNDDDKAYFTNKIISLAETLEKHVNSDGYVCFSEQNDRNDSLSTTLFAFAALNNEDILNNGIVEKAENCFETATEDLQLKNDLLSLPYTMPVNFGIALLPAQLTSLVRTTNDVRTALGAFALATAAYYKKYGDKIDLEFKE